MHPSASRCVYASSNTPLFGQEARSNLFPDCIWFEFVNRHPWAAQSSGNVLWETMVALPNQTPLYQIKHSMHVVSLGGLSQQAFTELRSTLQALLPNVDLGMFSCLNPGVWIHDNVMSLFIDCLRRGMPLPSSPASSEVQPPSMLRSSKGSQVDFAELCILDSPVSYTHLTLPTKRIV